MSFSMVLLEESSGIGAIEGTSIASAGIALIVAIAFVIKKVDWEKMMERMAENRNERRKRKDEISLEKKRLKLEEKELKMSLQKIKDEKEVAKILKYAKGRK